MMPQLSVIVPSYNTAKYIGDTILSLERDVPDAEIIVVDDASTDGTAAVLADLACPNLRVVQLEKNSPGGAGYPSNVGIDLASGDYIAFVDSDDYLGPGYLSSLLRVAVQKSADVCIGSYTLVDTVTHIERKAYDWDRWIRILSGSQEGHLTKEQYLLLSPEPWRKIYRKKVFADQSVRFPVNGWFNEDYPFHWLVGFSAESERMAFADKCNYYHRTSRLGQTTSAIDRRSFSIFDHTEVILSNIPEGPDQASYKASLLRWLSIGIWKLRFVSHCPDVYYANLKALFGKFSGVERDLFLGRATPRERKMYACFMNSSSVEELFLAMNWPAR